VIQVESTLLHYDAYGRRWPDRGSQEFCAVCGQPDNCGDCEHQPYSVGEAILLGAVGTIEEVQPITFSTCANCGKVIRKNLNNSTGWEHADSPVFGFGGYRCVAGRDAWATPLRWWDRFTEAFDTFMTRLLSSKP
jgi:hypothetical protein